MLKRKANLFAAVNDSLGLCSKFLLNAVGLLLLLLVGMADYRTGVQVNISIFYLIPISLIAWFGDRRGGVLFSILSTMAAFAAEVATESTRWHSIVTYWHHGLDLAFFLIIVLILSALRREYERTLKLNSELQEALSELKVTQDQLEQQSQELARSNVELERFARVAAHDLTGPLVTTGAYLRRLRDQFKDGSNEKTHRIMCLALAAVTKMEGLVGGLLAYARVGSGKKDIRHVRCDKVVEQVLSNLQAEIEQSGATVTYDRLPSVFGNELELVQLFQNLIGNAIKFHGEQSPQVSVTAEQGEKEIVFSVLDNGIGIEVQELGRIFNVFERLHSDSEYPGSGIGLGICKKIVESHGGRIWAESKVGKGSTFYFTLPTTEGATEFQQVGGNGAPRDEKGANVKSAHDLLHRL